jgi:hypothetical protein
MLLMLNQQKISIALERVVVGPTRGPEKNREQRRYYYWFSRFHD